jgi:hypothetical protein
MRTAMYTENISRSGLLVAWKGEGTALPTPSVGQILTIEVELPANHGFGQKCIHCQGSVTRVSQDPECPHVALRINYMDFRAFHDRLRMIDSLQPAVKTWMA